MNKIATSMLAVWLLLSLPGISDTAAEQGLGLHLSFEQADVQLLTTDDSKVATNGFSLGLDYAFTQHWLITINGGLAAGDHITRERLFFDVESNHLAIGISYNWEQLTWFFDWSMREDQSLSEDRQLGHYQQQDSQSDILYSALAWRVSQGDFSMMIEGGLGLALQDLDLIFDITRDNASTRSIERIDESGFNAQVSLQAGHIWFFEQWALEPTVGVSWLQVLEDNDVSASAGSVREGRFNARIQQNFSDFDNSIGLYQFGITVYWSDWLASDLVYARSFASSDNDAQWVVTVSSYF